MSTALLLAAAALAAPSALRPASGASHLIVIAGVGGEPQAREAFHEQATALATAAEKQMGLPGESVWCLTEDPDRTPVIDAASRREGIEQAFEAVAAASAPGDLVVVVLIGHGSERGGQARFNLPGRDMTPADFETLLDPLSGRRIAFVNTASASGGWVSKLAGKDRVVITATKSGMERNQTVFGRFFVDALAGDGADSDKNGRVSVLEAFEYARREVARFYEAEGQLQTEHALLEDDGAGDGALARAAFLAPATGAGSAEAALDATDDPALAALLAERADLEARLEELKGRRDAMPAAEYDAELEELLVELSLKSVEIRAAAEAAR